MGDCDLEPVKAKEEEDVAASDAGINGHVSESCGPVLRKEPSFSRWCDEFGNPCPDRPPDDGSVEIGTADDSEEFELPLLQGSESAKEFSEKETREKNNVGQKSIRSNTENGGRSYLPLDIDNTMGGMEKVELATGSSLSVWFVLKILFYILVWYTFSTCLTL